MAIAKGLYTEGHYGGPSSRRPNDWSPGAPLLYAGVYFLTGGVHVKAALILVALLGTGTILFTYLLGRRLGGPIAGVIGALLAATYPAFVENNGRLLAEPVALFWLPAAMLAFLWASDGGRPWRWLAPGALLGLTTLTRPEYLPFVAAVRAARARARVARPPAAACSAASPPRRCSSPPSAPCWRRGRRATRSCSTASCRSPRAAARRCSSPPTCPATAASSSSSAS